MERERPFPRARCVAACPPTSRFHTFNLRRDAPASRAHTPTFSLHHSLLSRLPSTSTGTHAALFIPRATHRTLSHPSNTRALSNAVRPPPPGRRPRVLRDHHRPPDGSRRVRPPCGPAFGSGGGPLSRHDGLPRHLRCAPRSPCRPGPPRPARRRRLRAVHGAGHQGRHASPAGGQGAGGERGKGRGKGGARPLSHLFFFSRLSRARCERGCSEGKRAQEGLEAADGPVLCSMVTSIWSLVPIAGGREAERGLGTVRRRRTNHTLSAASKRKKTSSSTCSLFLFRSAPSTSSSASSPRSRPPKPATWRRGSRWRRPARAWRP